MSYDIFIAGENINSTFNNAKIFDIAGLSGTYSHLSRLHGLTGKEALPIIHEALLIIIHKYEYLRSLELANGWGGVNDSMRTLVELSLACTKNLDAKICIST